VESRNRTRRKPAPRSVKHVTQPKEQPLSNIEALINDGGQITLGHLYPIKCVAIASDQHNSLAMLQRRHGETVSELLARLDAAIDRAWTHDEFIDEINAPPSQR
jgi:hypothetical protein